jgi:hypothetical protein
MAAAGPADEPQQGPRISTSLGVLCLLGADGQVSCSANTMTRQSGVATPRPGTYADIDTGPARACGLRADGAVFCWGNDEFGAATPPSGRFVEVGAGCALREDRSVVCWGEDGLGQASPPGGRWDHIAVGDTHRCAWTEAGALRCWGSSAKALQRMPREAREAGIARLDIGKYGACALGRDRRARCWGDRKLFKAFDAPPVEFLDVATDGDVACGVTLDGGISCWSAWMSEAVVRDRPRDSGYVAIDLGSSHACALRSDGSATCWGMDPPQP